MSSTRATSPPRDFGGLQAYPSRTKDPDVADFSTGSVGLGATAPLFAAAARRYIDSHFGSVADRPARFIALVGDAELDEGNVWEAITDPLQGLGEVMWVVDVNRQSLDRVIPEMKVQKLMRVFADSGWHVVEAKYGQQLCDAFERPGGAALRRHVDDMSNEQYQSLFSSRVPNSVTSSAPGPTRRLALRSPTSPTTTRRLDPEPRRARPPDIARRFGPVTPSPIDRASCSPTRSRAGGSRSRATP